MEIHENLFQGDDPTDDLDVAAFAPFEPINDLVLVKLWQEDNSKIGSIVVAEKYRQRSNRGIVIAMGDKVAARINIGDRVLLGIGNVEDVVVDGENLLLIREGDIRGYERGL